MTTPHLYHLSHIDLDGYGCQYLTSKHFVTAHCYNANYGPEVKARLEEIVAQIERDLFLDQTLETLILITDLNLSTKEGHYIEKEAQRLGAELQLLDHHATGANAAEKFAWYTLDTTRCATLITYDWLREKYGFDVVDESKKLLNPIAEEFNAMRSTLLINLLDSIKRNTSYGIKRIPLFEIGTVFDSNREESERVAFVWSGHAEVESVSNHGKAKSIEFASFMDRLSSVIGDVTLTPCDASNGLMHPYQSASIIKDAQIIGHVSKLHPTVAEDYGVSDTMIAELDFAPLMPEHIVAKPISNYQGVYKDLSIVVDRSLSFSQIYNSIDSLDEQILRGFSPVDVYEDESLGEQKSVTVRFYIQSMDGTLSDKLIDGVMQSVLAKLESDCGARLR
jgi:phenylalanyl-tRNA synthetase beta subunit